MRKHERSLSTIIMAKADFLVSLQANIGQSIHERLEGFRLWEQKIDAMPTRGSVQREKRQIEYVRLQTEYDSFRLRIGSQVLHTFGFVLEHRKYLGLGTRKLLVGKESK